MIIAGQNFNVVDTFNTMTVADCCVVQQNKLGRGHGEAKFYVGSKDEMRGFYGGEGFDANCFILKSDLIKYMETIKDEYFHPSQDYRAKDEFASLWKERMERISSFGEVIRFNIQDQTQIAGPRGYVNSTDDGFNLVRTLSLPLVSYISAMQLREGNGTPIYYWKLFVDFDAISEKKNGALVFNYGKGKTEKIEEVVEKKETTKNKEIRYARLGQGKYREALLNECPFCPITMINDERLLVASHIKPWAVSTDKEKIDAKNGFMLSALFDKLFDRGLISFTDDKHMLVSNWITPQNVKRMGLIDGKYYQMLPIDEQRKHYLEYHRSSVFKG